MSQTAKYLDLTKASISKQNIFVAHSYGAMYAGYFVLKNPDLVHGFLLADPVPRSFNFSNKQMQQLEKSLSDAKIKPASYIYKKYPRQRAEVFYQLLGFDESKKSIDKLGNINNAIPVVIISSSGMEKIHPLTEDWYASQKQWLNQNPMSKTIRISSGHFIQLEEPQKVCNELKQIVNYEMTSIIN